MILDWFIFLCAASFAAAASQTTWRLVGSIILLACLSNIALMHVFEAMQDDFRLGPTYALIDAIVALACMWAHRNGHGGGKMMAWCLLAFIATHWAVTMQGLHEGGQGWFYSNYYGTINALNVLQAVLICGGLAREYLGFDRLGRGRVGTV